MIMIDKTQLISSIEERPMVGSSLDDLDKTRLEQYFSRRFPD